MAAASRAEQPSPSSTRITVDVLADEAARLLAGTSDPMAMVRAGRRLDEAARVLELLPSGFSIWRVGARCRRAEFLAYDERGRLVGKALRASLASRESRVSAWPLSLESPAAARALAVVSLLAALDAEAQA